MCIIIAYDMLSPKYGCVCKCVRAREKAKKDIFKLMSYDLVSTTCKKWLRLTIYHESLPLSSKKLQIHFFVRYCCADSTLRNIRTNIVCCSWCVDVVVAAAAAHDDSFL